MIHSILSSILLTLGLATPLAASETPPEHKALIERAIELEYETSTFLLPDNKEVTVELAGDYAIITVTEDGRSTSNTIHVKAL